MARRAEVAQAAGVVPSAARMVPDFAIRGALAETIDATVLEVALSQPATYWTAGGRYWLDDPAFGPVVAFDDLIYDPELGLTARSWGHGSGA